MTRTRRNVRDMVIAATILGASAALHRMLDHYKILDLTPISIFELTASDGKALALTFGAAVVAWICGIALGYLAGMAISTITVERLHLGEVVRWAKTFNFLFDAVYIVPLVVTLSLAGGFALYIDTHAWWLPRWVTGLGLVICSGFVLGGYQIYAAVYYATVQSRRETRALMRSLYLRPRGLGARLGRFGHRLRLVKSYRDAEIRSFAEAMKRALHLSIVAVMILEVVRPGIYESFFPSTGAQLGWTNGAGYGVQIAQSNFLFVRMSGVLWSVLFFDLFAVRLLEELMDHRWLQFDKARQ